MISFQVKFEDLEVIETTYRNVVFNFINHVVIICESMYFVVIFVIILIHSKLGRQVGIVDIFTIFLHFLVFGVRTFILSALSGGVITLNLFLFVSTKMKVFSKREYCRYSGLQHLTSPSLLLLQTQMLTARNEQVWFLPPPWESMLEK